MLKHCIFLYTPFAEYDEYLPDFPDCASAIAWVKANDWTEQIDRNGLYRVVAKKLKKNRYRVSILIPYYLAQFDEISSPMDAFKKGGLEQYIKRGMAYAIYHNDIFIKEVV